MNNVTALRNNFLLTHGMLMRFIDICPDSIWVKTSGGFPVWQQVFHAFACYDFFVRAEGAAPTALFFGASEGDVVSFKERPEPLGKAELREIAEKAKGIVDAFLASQAYATLSEKHAGLSARLGNEMSNLGMLAFISSHNLYHLGSCDAALRDEGLEGVF